MQRDNDHVAFVNDVAGVNTASALRLTARGNARIEQFLHWLESTPALAKFGIASKTQTSEKSTSDSFRNNRANRRGERHRGSDRLLFSAEARRREFQGALSVSSGKNAVVSRQSAAPNVPLLRLRSGRKRFPFRDGLRAHRFSLGGPKARRAGRHSDDRGTRAAPRKIDNTKRGGHVAEACTPKRRNGFTTIC